MVTLTLPEQQIDHDWSASIRSRLQAVVDERDWTSPYASILLPLQEAHISKSEKRLVIIIGIGGSSLGAYAITRALPPKAEIVFIENIAPHIFPAIIGTIRQRRLSQNDIACYLISKSGGTTEAIANYALLEERLATACKIDILPITTIISDEDSSLSSLAKDMALRVVTIPKMVGGRYSVFSAVGMAPLSRTEIDTDALLSGAKGMLMQCLREDSPAVRLATFLFHAQARGVRIVDLFFFDDRLEYLGKWCRQLYAESLGKDGKGLLPTVSIGTVDLHSMVQLYLGSGIPMVTVFARAHDRREGLPIAKTPFTKLVDHLADRQTYEVTDAIYDGVTASYQDHHLDFAELLLPTIDAYHLGEFMQLHMVTVMMLGDLLKVNPFDQPNVEEYKEHTRERLRDYT